VVEGVIDCWAGSSGAIGFGCLPRLRFETWGTRRCLRSWRIGAGEEGIAAGFGFGAEVVEFDVAEDGGLDS